MTHIEPIRRDELRRASTVVAVLAALVATMAGLAIFVPSASAAATLAGAAQIVVPSGGAGAGTPLTSGSSTTPFSLKVPSGAHCAADGLNGGRWHTYMVPASEDPAGIVFATNGALVGASTGTGGTGTFRQSLFNPAGTPVRGQAPGVGDAAIINIPAFSFGVWSPGNVPTGTYNVGIACVDLDLSVPRDNFWNAQLQIVADAQDPVGIGWTAVTTPTTSSTTSTSTPGSTTTTGASTSTTSTTLDPATTTTVDATTTSLLDGSTSTTFGDPSVLGGSVGGGGGSGSLPVTGAPAIVFAVAAFVMLVAGRAAILLGRPTPVVERPRS